MFGLAEQIHGHPVRWCCAIGQHQNFARAGNHVDAHRTKHTAFGSSNIGIARASDFVNGWNGLRAISQGGHGLRAANGERTADACHIGSGQHQCVFFVMRRWHHHDDVLNARHMRRNGIHQYAGGVSSFSTWYINSHAVEWCDFLSQQSAVRIAVCPTLATGFFLCLVVAAHARSCSF